MSSKPASQASAAAHFVWEDPFLLESQLSEEENLIRQTNREFAQSQLQPRVSAAYLNETADAGIFQELGALGLLGITIPAEYGGAGAAYVSYGVVAREIERVDSGYRSMSSVQSSLVMHPIFAFGSETQRRKFLPGLACGKLIGCFGLTEPGAGSDPSGIGSRTAPSRTCSSSGPSPRRMTARFAASFSRNA